MNVISLSAVRLFPIALTAYFFIALLFIVKYGLRVAEWPVVSIMGLVYILLMLTLLRRVLPWLLNHAGKRLLLSAVFVTVLLLLFFQSLIDPYTLQIDRWSAIHNHLDYFLHGYYPYAAQTHLGGYGSPFPVWQLFHLPFFFLGNVGWSFSAGVGLFGWAVSLLGGWKKAVVVMVLLFTHPAFLYEVSVRSDLLTNFLVSAAIVLFLWHYRAAHNLSWCAVAVVCGLLMSTRLTAIVPMAVFFMVPWLRTGWLKCAGLVFTSLIVFGLTFLPLLLWDGDALLFFEYNPFVLQTRQSHAANLLLVVLFGILMAWWWCGGSDRCEPTERFVERYAFATAACLLLLVVVTFTHNMWLTDSWGGLFSSQYDITYFNMSLPFLLLIISGER